ASRDGPRAPGAPLAGGGVGGLEHDPRHAFVAEAPGQGEVIDAPVNHVRSDVYVQVIGAGHQLPSPAGWRRMNLLWHELDSSSAGRTLITEAGCRGGRSAGREAAWALALGVAVDWVKNTPRSA